MVKDKFSEIDIKHKIKIEKDKYFKFKKLVLNILLDILKFVLKSFRFDLDKKSGLNVLLLDQFYFEIIMNYIRYIT